MIDIINAESVSISQVAAQADDTTQSATEAAFNDAANAEVSGDSAATDNSPDILDRVSFDEFFESLGADRAFVGPPFG
jgi:hypothetical protein